MLDILVFARGALSKEILSAVDELGSAAYATNIDRFLCQKTNATTKLQQVHTALKRLEKQGRVAVAGTEPSEFRRRPRIIYRLTQSGLAELHQYRGQEFNNVSIKAGAT